MTDQPDPKVTNTDVLESGPEGPARALPRAAVAGALVLAIAAAAGGYLVGNRDRSDSAAAPAPAPSAGPVGGQPVAASGKRCSVQLKNRLQLGIEIVNESATTVSLHSAQAVLPLQGLRPTDTTWGSCGQLPPADNSDDDHPLPAGATTWLAITFDVLADCPGPLPVRFTVGYTQAGASGTAGLPGFPDLSDVPYTSAKCPSGSS